MPRNAYSTLQYANDNLRRNCVTINDNELMPYKIPTTPTNTNFIRVFYIYKFSFYEIFMLSNDRKRKRER
ncbi:hypothetical protein Hanom_Chr10g00942351 [Helianthus anomalus]